MLTTNSSFAGPKMDGPAVRAPTHHGFGGRVIKGMIDLLKAKPVLTGVRRGLFAKCPFRHETAGASKVGAGTLAALSLDHTFDDRSAGVAERISEFA
jgi:hypothetical protein